MTIKVNSGELSKRLEKLSMVLESKMPIPILSNVLVEARDGVLRLTTSDSDVWLSVKCPVVEGCDGMRFCINTKDLLMITKNVNEKDLLMSFNEESHTIICDYGNGRFSMPYENADEFPSVVASVEDMSSVTIDGKKILKAIELTEFAVGNSITRPVINGIHFGFHGEYMSASATDTFKVAIYKDFSVQGDVHGGFVLPKKPCVILSSVLRLVDGDVKVSFSKNSISFNNKDFKMTARLIEGMIPKYESVIPSAYTLSITMDKGSLVQALRRVIPMTDEISNLVTMLFEKGKVTVSCNNEEFGKSAVETLVCECESEMKVSFKGSLLLDTLKNIDDDNVVVEIASPTQGCVFCASSSYTKDEYISLLCPFLT